MSFHGAKLAILSGGRVLTILRDDRPDIPFPGHWDLPGGGREGDESPAACVLRETREELGLALSEADLIWRRAFDDRGEGAGWFFVHRDDGFDPGRVRFGDEGQGWELMPVAAFLSHPRAVPRLVKRLLAYLEEGRVHGFGSE